MKLPEELSPFARSLRDFRVKKGWSQTKLENELREKIDKKDRKGMAKLISLWETDQRTMRSLRLHETWIYLLDDILGANGEIVENIEDFEEDMSFLAKQSSSIEITQFHMEAVADTLRIVKLLPEGIDLKILSRATRQVGEWCRVCKWEINEDELRHLLQAALSIADRTVR